MRILSNEPRQGGRKGIEKEVLEDFYTSLSFSNPIFPYPVTNTLSGGENGSRLERQKRPPFAKRSGRRAR